MGTLPIFQVYNFLEKKGKDECEAFSFFLYSSEEERKFMQVVFAKYFTFLAEVVEFLVQPMRQQPIVDMGPFPLRVPSYAVA